MTAAWQPAGYASPNPTTYPWLWLWDSCFHAVIWAALGDERALVELTSIFANQGNDGFVPHMGFGIDSSASRSSWGRTGASTITQPPLFGHSIRVLVDAGYDVPERLIDQATRAFHYLWTTRRRGGDLTVIAHPWESGCDDSARWGSWMPDPFTKPEWDTTKRRLVRSATVVDGGVRANEAFEVASVAFNACLAYSALELATVTGDRTVASMATAITEALESRWRPELDTWADGTHSSATAPTLEALLPLLVVDDPIQCDRAWAAIADRDRFWAPFGLRQTSRADEGYNPDAYWRGSSWPQLDYLLWLAAHRQARTGLAQKIADTTVAGAATSGMSEYWNPESGTGRGAIPQSWTALAWVMQQCPIGRN